MTPAMLGQAEFIITACILLSVIYSSVAADLDRTSEGLWLGSSHRIAPQHVARERSRANNGRFYEAVVRDGIPEGVQCDVTQRCDSRNVCARVCARGTVQIDPWLRYAVDYQWALARRQPLCYAQLLGSHNSAITLADGYGMHDDIYTDYLRYLGLASGSQRLTTNNQVLSLTDQLNLGLRFVELDVHWIQSSLRIAHCGGFHSARLDSLVRLLSRVAALFGHPPVEWDAETLGCDPSLSSLPTRDQRLFSSALAEVAAWLASPGRESEFLVIYLDDQPDLAAWGRVGELLEQVTEAIPAELIITPAELRAATAELGAPPSIDQLVSRYRKRVLLMSASDYGAAMAHLAHDHRSPCNFSEPLFRGFTGAPNCSFHNWRFPAYTPAMHGRLIRTPTCHLSYGPYNCSMQRGENTPQLDLQAMPDATACGINVPSPDLLTPELLTAFVWSWAPGHPPPAAATAADSPAGEAGKAMDGAPTVTAMSQAGDSEVGEQCAAMRSSDARWLVVPCGAVRLAACRRDAGPQHLSSSDVWALVASDAPCPAGYLPGAPHTARENYELWRTVALVATPAPPTSRPEAMVPLLRRTASPATGSIAAATVGVVAEGAGRRAARRSGGGEASGSQFVGQLRSAPGSGKAQGDVWVGLGSSRADGSIMRRRRGLRQQERTVGPGTTGVEDGSSVGEKEGRGRNEQGAAQGTGTEEVLVRLALRPPAWLP